jgi:DhnA family fructose-bisphosphate aldolase class Ia
MDCGAAGCAIGRNVYGSDDPGARIKALRKVVHGE